MKAKDIWKEKDFIPTKNAKSLSSLIGPYSKLIESVPAIGAICQRRNNLTVFNGMNIDKIGVSNPTPGKYKEMVIKAADMIITHIRQSKPILVWGDYDVDGMTATSIMYLILKECGGKVEWGIPSRETDGYGMSYDAIRAKCPQPGLVITVDNGITGHEVTGLLKNNDYTVIITDHHLPEETLPGADLVVNPKCYLTEEDDEYMASGCYVSAQIALKVCEQLRLALYDKYLNIANSMISMSIVSDIIDLNPTLRLQMIAGLVALNTSEHDGINALLKMCFGKSNNREITSQTLAFNVVPKLNAAGRMDSVINGMNVLNCVFDESFGKATALICANDLKSLNTKRKIVEDQVFKQAYVMLEEYKDNTPPAIVVYHPEWMAGIVGIVAARIVEDFHVPAIVLCGSKDKVHGSGRAPDGIDLHSCIGACAEHITQFGGHKAAAGVSLTEDKVDDFRKAFIQAVIDNTKDYVPVYEYDAEVKIVDLMDVRLLMFLSNVEPTGKGNDPVTFRINDVVVTNTFYKGEALNMVISDETGMYMTIERWHAPAGWAGILNHRIDVLVSASFLYFTGNTNVSWRIEAIRDVTMELS